MSLIPRCVQCDAPTDPYGRDGGMPLCEPCRVARMNEDEQNAYFSPSRARSAQVIPFPRRAA